ncbi:hypothetical protein ACFPM0_28740 [Pseudonocardia sulfidoxydans]|uniref:hypothetical protein n=1 Tax=Pseudonocardia sulfidoxydans TaxID=54011 RepID=UPI003624175C
MDAGALGDLSQRHRLGCRQRCASRILGLRATVSAQVRDPDLRTVSRPVTSVAASDVRNRTTRPPSRSARRAARGAG